MRPNVKEFCGSSVGFVDGTIEDKVGINSVTIKTWGQQQLSQVCVCVCSV